MKRRLLMALATLLLLMLPLFLSYFSNNIGQKATAESIAMVCKSLDQAVVECYALEGFYPPNLGYLEERYGISIDKTLYYVDYFYLGSNLKPDITVLPVSKGGTDHG